jgi:hypothetical protein
MVINCRDTTFQFFRLSTPVQFRSLFFWDMVPYYWTAGVQHLGDDIVVLFSRVEMSLEEYFDLDETTILS